MEDEREIMLTPVGVAKIIIANTYPADVDGDIIQEEFRGVDIDSTSWKSSVMEMWGRAKTGELTPEGFAEEIRSLNRRMRINRN